MKFEEVYGPLSRQEKLQVITAVITGIADKPMFCLETLKGRIEKCLLIAEEILFQNQSETAKNVHYVN